MEEKKVMENPEMKNKIDDFENILNGTIIKCYKYHELVSDLEYDNLIFGDDTVMSTIEISRNLNNFSRLYSFKNRPNDISFKKQKTIYQSAIIKHSNTVDR